MPKSGFTQTFRSGSQIAWYGQITDLSSAIGLPKATAGRRAVFHATGQNVRWRPDGVDPDSTTGMLLRTLATGGDEVEFVGDLTKLRFIETVVGGILNVTIYR